MLSSSRLLGKSLVRQSQKAIESGSRSRSLLFSPGNIIRVTIWVQRGIQGAVHPFHTTVGRKENRPEQREKFQGAIQGQSNGGIVD